MNHVCCAYEDTTEFRDGAAAFLSEGVAAGHRAEYIASGDIDALRDEVASVPELTELLQRGDLVVRSLDDRYGAGDVIEPCAQVAAYDAATEDALALGYAGLRVVADATVLVRTAAQRHAIAQYEHLVDRYMTAHPFSALCAYDARRVGPAVAAELSALHPRGTGWRTSFRWHGASVADVTLVGEVDLGARELFDLVVARTMPLMARQRIVVDAEGLTFIDHRGMLLLEHHAEAVGAEIVLRTSAAIPHRLAALLDLRWVRTERPS